MPGWLIVTLGTIGAGLWYMGHCVLRPYAACRRCDGAGRFRSWTGRSWRRCRRCHGSGERIRLGRRVWDTIQRRRNGRD